MPENQNNCILSCDNLFEALMSLFYCSDINVFSIDIYNLQYMIAPRRGQLQEYHHTEVTLEEQHCFSYY